MWRIMSVLIVLISIAGCASHPRYVDLKSLRSESYLGLKDKLGYETYVDLDNWQHIEINAMLLHEELSEYHSEIPSDGTGVEFFVRDPYAEFLIGNYELIVDTGPGESTSILGLGTGNMVVRGTLKPMEHRIRLIRIEGPVGVKARGIKRFMLVLPIKLDENLDRLLITGTDIYDTDRRFQVRWNFKPPRPARHN